MITTLFYAFIQRVFLPESFLAFTLPPKIEVDCVGINKRARRVISEISFSHFWKSIGGLHLGWHNSEKEAKNIMNGVVCVISIRVV